MNLKAYKNNLVVSKAYPILKSYAVYFMGAYLILLGAAISIWFAILGSIIILAQAVYDLVFVARNVRQKFLLLWLDAKAKRWILYKIEDSSTLEVLDVSFIKTSLRFTDTAKKVKQVRLVKAEGVELQRFPFPFRIPFPAEFLSREVLHINQQDSNIVMSSSEELQNIDVVSRPMGSHELVDIGVSGY
tara:strand:- start:2468 stop:3031 length:564 start_codon:yes stop_codon:yes gene_type:complete